MKRSLLIMAITFSVTVAVIFGLRVSADALAVVIGVVLGAAASIPTTFLFTYLLLRNRPAATGDPPRSGYPQPPVVVINAADKPSVSAPPALPGIASAAPGSRQWTMIGDEETGD